MDKKKGTNIIIIVILIVIIVLIAIGGVGVLIVGFATDNNNASANISVSTDEGTTNESEQTTETDSTDSLEEDLNTIEGYWYSEYDDAVYLFNNGTIAQDGTDIATYETSGNILTLYVNDSDSVYNYTWSVEGDRLTLEDVSGWVYYIRTDGY
jgi:predicted metalloprotease